MTRTRRSSHGQQQQLVEEDGLLIMEEEGVSNTYDPTPLANGQWNSKKYCERIALEVIKESEDQLELEFDLIGVEAPFANALRRILIAEVPSMAIEKVFLYQNTSCIQDEVLCHRLGLIPIRADPREFNFPPLANSTESQKMNSDYLDEEPAGDSKTNLIFEINVSCAGGEHQRSKKKRHTGKTESGGGESEESSEGCVKEAGESGNWLLYTSAFKWVPIEDQKAKFESRPPRLVHKDIILAKLRPNQEMEARCHCVKGVGKDHAKFSPVATATYRLLPQIKLNTTEFDDDQAKRLQSSFSRGVIGRDERTGRVYVKNARADSSSRNVFMHEDLKGAVQMGKNKTYFIFSVESTGILPSDQLVVEACEVMKEKVDALLEQCATVIDELSIG